MKMIIQNIFRKIIIQKIFRVNKNSLPCKSQLANPKMNYHLLANGIIWEDEGLSECHPDLENALRPVIDYRTYLIMNHSQNIKSREHQFNKEIFESSRKYFPDWIGFDEARCSYNPELSNKIKRIQKVSEYKLNKLIDSDFEKQ